MTAQAIPNLVYGVLLLIALMAPYAATGRAARAREAWLSDGIVAIAILIGAILLTILRQGNFALFSVVLLIPLVGRGERPLAGGVAAVLLAAPVTWWLPAPLIHPVAMAAFILLAVIAAYLPRAGRSAVTADGEVRAGTGSLLLPMTLCAALGLVAGAMTAPFGSAEPIYLAWHHWGAYLAPVEAWLSGGLPYRDFPVQYGLGPTMLLAATCGHDCWHGLYAVAVTANALYFATLAGGVLLLTEGRPRGERSLALIALFCACFIWTAFPINLAGPVMTPSVAGLRFLPISALLLHVLRAEERGKTHDLIGHGLWLVDLLWSPEAAFFGTLIWWPYLAIRDAAGAGDMRGALLALSCGAVRGVVALGFALGGLAALVWWLSGRAVTPATFLAYIQYPPGALPVNPLGTVWIGLAAVALGIQSLAGRGMASPGRSLYACLLGVLAAGSYYLSRSHDNNILNLFPLLILLLLATVRARQGEGVPDFAQGFVHTLLAAMVAFVATCNVGPWADGVAQGRLLERGPGRLIARFTPHYGDSPQILSSDAVEALTYLRARGVGSVVLADARAVMPRTTAGTGWTGVNNLANFTPLPDAMILHYIRRGAIAYGRPGWLVVDDGHDGHWVNLFAAAYDVREHLRFGSYSAYHLVPRKEGAAGAARP